MALQYAIPQPAIAGPSIPAHPVAIRTLYVLLFLVVFSSFYTFIQPSPYEILMVPLVIACLAARVTVDIKVMPLVLLLVILQIGGLLSLMPVLDDSDARHFMYISVYLSVTAVLFAIVFTEDCILRIAILRSAYILAAVIASILGIIGYFQLVPGADAFMAGERAVATFTDPNIFGPFLILPLLLIVERFVAGVVRIRYIIAGIIIPIGLLLAFSRAAWGHFAFSAALMIVLLFVTTPSARTRGRLVVFTLTSVLVGSLLLVGLYSIEDVRVMIEQRFALLQEYDVGTSGSRFSIQARSIEEILNNPNGMGPWIFGKKYGLVSHNSYLGIMLNHGWIGGIAYLTLVLATLAFGFRALLIHTPWQPVLIATYATFFGLALESIVVDTDHWRHWYLLLGMVWGLSVATMNARRPRSPTVAASPLRDQPILRFYLNDMRQQPASSNGGIRHFRL